MVAGLPPPGDAYRYPSFRGLPITFIRRPFAYDVGDIVKGRCAGTAGKSGLFIDVDYWQCWLPRSHVSVTRPNKLSSYVGQEFTCEILKITQERFGLLVVLSRRSLIELSRFSELDIGQSVDGKLHSISASRLTFDLNGILGYVDRDELESGNNSIENIRIGQACRLTIMQKNKSKMNVKLKIKQNKTQMDG